MKEEGQGIQSVKIPCTADSDDDESELEAGGFGGQVVSALAFHLWGRRFESH
jgi:hypothetical protein